MNVQIPGLLAALILFLQPVPLRSAEPPAISSAENDRASAIERLGRTIFEYDRAAAVATDRLSALGLHDDKRVRGWITEESDDGIRVTIVGMDGDDLPRALYGATVDRSGKPIGVGVRNNEPAPLTDRQAALYRARTRGLSADFNACAKNYNTVTVPGDTGISVYLLPGTSDPGAVPIGGSYRIDYDADGETQLAMRAYTRSCIVLQKDEKAAGLLITHLMDDFPTEVHVYWNLWADSPLYVGIAQTRSLWVLSDGKLRLAMRGK